MWVHNSIERWRGVQRIVSLHVASHVAPHLVKEAKAVSGIHGLQREMASPLSSRGIESKKRERLAAPVYSRTFW
jgi:regulator of sigma D